MAISSALRKALLLFAAALIFFGLVKSPMFGFNEITGLNGGGFELGLGLSVFVLLNLVLLVAALYFGRERG